MSMTETSTQRLSTWTVAAGRDLQPMDGPRAIIGVSDGEAIGRCQPADETGVQAGRTWFKVHPQNWLCGSIRSEVPIVRAVFIDLLAMAADGHYNDEGLIKATPAMGYSDEQTASLVGLSTKVYRRVKQSLVNSERIALEPNNVIRIVNWRRYQTPFDQQKEHRDAEYSRFRDTVLAHYDLRCRACGKHQSDLKVPLCVFPIDGNEDSRDADNYVTLCLSYRGSLARRPIVIQRLRGQQCKADHQLLLADSPPPETDLRGVLSREGSSRETEQEEEAEDETEEEAGQERVPESLSAVVGERDVGERPFLDALRALPGWEPSEEEADYVSWLLTEHPSLTVDDIGQLPSLFRSGGIPPTKVLRKHRLEAYLQERRR